MKSVIISPTSGFCFGVKRAVGLLEEAVGRGEKICSLGDVIHNKNYMDSVITRGVKIIEPDEIENSEKESIIFIRAHGIEQQITQKLKDGKYKFIDATCPYVKKIHEIVKSNSKDGSLCIVLGDENHPEVQGIVSYACGNYKVFSKASQALDYIKTEKINSNDFFTVFQTTYSIEESNFFSKKLKNLYTNTKIFGTICGVTEERQLIAAKLCRECDAAIIVGSEKSSNTKKLFDIAAKNCSTAFMIQNALDLDRLLPKIADIKKTVIIAGASTPDDVIQEVYIKMSEIIKEELTFGEMLDKSFKSLITGEKTIGIISAVSAAELKVDLGTKHTGILPSDEISSESGVDLLRDYKIGEEIEVMCIKFSDSEGTVLLSKKRLDVPRNLAMIADSVESGEILEGIVRETVNKGVIVFVKGIRVFVPASHVGIKEENFEKLKGQNVKINIIEYNPAKRRIIGSIKNAARSVRKQEKDAFFQNTEIGQKFTGTVRSITSYGAFINIGPVDGMIHVTELTWGRFTHPSEIVSIGDKIDVFIKSMDPEKGRISLGFKTEENNPWTIFNSNYAAGDVVNVKIVNIMPFGAFAEIIPGVDGLIHGSQISDKFVPNPASVLKIGDKLDVMITEIEIEKKRISLSIKALVEPEFSLPEAETTAEEAPVPEKTINETASEKEVVLSDEEN